MNCVTVVRSLQTHQGMMYDFEDHDLFLTPKVCFFSSIKGGASRHMMVNGSNQKMAIKIKCSNNEIYRVSPVFCVLEPGMSQRLQVVRDPGPAKIDKIILLYKFTDAANPRDAFKENDEGVFKKLIALIAKEEVEVRLAPSTNLRSILKQTYPQFNQNG